jgi:hypothetical protein
VVSDFILSSLCQPIGTDLFRMEDEIREHLLSQTTKQTRTDVASFIEEYAIRNKSNLSKNVFEIHSLFAKGVLYPSEMEKEIIEKLESKINPNEKANYLNLYFNSLPFVENGTQKAGISLVRVDNPNEENVLKLGYLPKGIEGNLDKGNGNKYQIKTRIIENEVAHFTQFELFLESNNDFSLGINIIDRSQNIVSYFIYSKIDITNKEYELIINKTINDFWHSLDDKNRLFYIEKCIANNELNKSEFLNLSYYGISSFEEIENIFNFTHLKRLNLENNQITFFSLEFLKKLPNLEALYLKGNPIKNIPREIYDIVGNCLEGVREYSVAEEEQQIRIIKEKVLRKECSHEELREYVSKGIFTLEELLNAGVISYEERKRISPYQSSKPMSKGAQVLDWDSIPPLQTGRVDIFVFGSVGSGKSLLMAGILKYADEQGRLEIKISNPQGFEYANFLIDSVKRGWVIDGTPVDYLQYMICDVIDKDKNINPLTFFEISGESFENIYLKNKDELPPRFQQYMFSSNTKILFLAVDYTSEGGDYSLRGQFEFLLEFLESHGIIQGFEAIIIVITKWDKSEDKSDEAAKEFLKDRFMHLVNLCKHMKDEYGIGFFIYTFSIGEFINEYTYEYNPQDSKKILDLLSSYTSLPSPKPTKKSDDPWWKRFTK